MKILYHHRTQGKGAEGVHIREVVHALRALGHEVYIISPPGVDPERKCTYSTDTPSGIGSIWKLVSKYAPQFIFELFELGYNLVAVGKITRMLKTRRIDYMYERNAFFCWAGVSLARRYHIPIILEVNEVSGIKRARREVFSGLAKSIEKNNFERADGIVVVSRFLKQHIEDMGISASKIHVIPNAVDLAKFNSDIKPRKEIIERFSLNREVMIGFVGSLIKWHNFEFLLDMLGDIMFERGASKSKLMLIGDGPLREQIKAYAQRKNILSNIIFTGNLPHEAIPEYIKLMDICVIPQSNKFRSPIKLFEYMAMGKPVVAPKLEPIETVIIDNVNGCLFEPGNSHELKNCLLSLMDNPERRKQLGEEAKKTIVAKYLWKYQVQKIVDIYQDCARHV